MTYSELLDLLGPEIKKQQLNHYSARVVTFQNGVALVSYSTMVAAKINNKYYFTSKHDCSHTTCRQVKTWCGIDAQTRRAMIKSGEAIFVYEYNTNFVYL